MLRLPSVIWYVVTWRRRNLQFSCPLSMDRDSEVKLVVRKVAKAVVVFTQSFWRVVMARKDRN